MRKKSTLLLLALVLIFSLSINIFANGTEEIRMGTLDSDSQYPFYDETDSLSEETKNVILNINKNAEDTGAQVGVILLNSLDGSTIEEKATKLFNTWGLGDKDKNNGVLILISKGDRQFRVEVGEGLRNTVLSDSEAADILEIMKPYCKDEAYNLAVQVGLFEIDKKFIEYRSLLQAEKDSKEETANKEEHKEVPSQAAGVISNTNKSNSSYNNNNSIGGLDVKTIASAVALILIIGTFVITMISSAREAKKEEKERQERIKARGKAVGVNIEVTNQYDMTETVKMSGYENDNIYISSVKDELNRLLRHGELFSNIYDENNKFTGFTILENNIPPENTKFKYLQDSTIKIKLKLIREEDEFSADEARLKATKDFYEKLTPEEKAFYTSRASSNQKSFFGTNFWFYMYLYMLLKSDRSNNFRNYMNNKNVKSDRFFTSAKDLKAREEARLASESNSSSSTFSSNLSSSFGSGSDFYNSGSSFGGFGGGGSSGGGASGGF